MIFPQCLGLKFWKIGSRKIYAVALARVSNKKKKILEVDTSSSDSEREPSRKIAKTHPSKEEIHVIYDGKEYKHSAFISQPGNVSFVLNTDDLRKTIADGEFEDVNIEKAGLTPISYIGDVSPGDPKTA